MKKYVENVDIKASDYVSMTSMGNHTEIQYLKNRKPAGECAIKKIDSERYVLKSTGEIKMFNKSKNRSENAESVRQTMKRLRNKINNNFFGDKNELFITLTYAENMMDSKKLYRDYDVFMKRLKRFFKAFELRALAVVEPQERGAFHMHVLVKLPRFKGYLYVKNETIQSMWGHGFCKTKKISSKNVDNLGAYLTAYLTDIEVDIDSEFGGVKKVSENGGEVEKRFVKGARLHFYKVGMNYYRCTRNCSMPISCILPYAEVLKKNLGKKVYENSFSIIDDNVDVADEKYSDFYKGRLLNTIKYEIYNLVRF